jgi:hypothetical protein
MSFPVTKFDGSGAVSHNQLTDIGTLTHDEIELALAALGGAVVLDHYNLAHIGTKTHVQLETSITAIINTLVGLQHAQLAGIGTLTHDQLETAITALQGLMTGVTGAPSTLSHANLLNKTADDHTQYVKVSGRAGDVVSIPNTTASTYTGDGALVVTGGIGAGGSVNAGGSLRLYDLVAPKTDFLQLYRSGTRTVAAMQGSAGTFTFWSSIPTVEMIATTASTSYSSGALVVGGAGGGGLGVGGSLHVGANDLQSNTIATRYTIDPGLLINCGGSQPLDMLCQYVGSGGAIDMTIGVAKSAGGCAQLRYVYRGGVATDSVRLRFWANAVDPVEIFQYGTVSSSTTTGTMTISGGLGVSGKINSATMAVTTAPAAANDVARLTDLQSGVNTFTSWTKASNWVEVSTPANTLADSFYMTKYGTTVTIGCKAQKTFTLTANSQIYFDWSDNPQKPAVTTHLPIILNVAGTSSVCKVMVYTTGHLYISPAAGTQFGAGQVVLIGPFCVSYQV